jgi:hypothetical protein
MAERRSEWLWGLGLLAFVGVAVLLILPPDARLVVDERLTTHRPTPDGASALFETLEELGLTVARRLTPLAGADPLQGPLAILAPTEPLSPAEVRAVVEWVEGGGRLILADRPGSPLAAALELPVQRFPATVALVPGADHPWVRDLTSAGPALRVFADTVREVGRVSAALLVGEEGAEPAVVLVQRGAGQILAISDPGLLSNGRISGSGLAPLLARVASDWTLQGSPLWFDEYHHGYRGGSLRAGLWGFLTGHPAGQATLYLSLVALLALASAATRLGSPRVRVENAARSPLEHVAALGEAYRQARADGLARRRLVAGFARRIGRERPRPGEEGAFLTRIQGRVPAGGEAVALVAEGWRDEVTVLELARRIDRAVDRLAGER